MRLLFALLAIAAIAAACSAGAGGGDDDDGSSPTPTASPSATPSPAPTHCLAARNELIHVFDDVGDLHTFDPALIGVSDPFSRVGTPNCTPGSALAPFSDPATPYAVAYANDDTLWTLYTSGELFRISALNAACTSTSFVPQQMAGGTTWSLFGVAFTTDTAGGASERLWISGGNVDGSLGDLGVLDPPDLSISRIGPIGGSAPMRPELMGLSDATLWGFFPDTNSGFVQEIDKATGGLLGTAKPVAPGGLTIAAWGAAQWGGDFYVFVTLTDGVATTNSTVRTVNRATGVDGLVLQNLPVIVTAAASATCAPID